MDRCLELLKVRVLVGECALIVCVEIFSNEKVSKEHFGFVCF